MISEQNLNFNFLIECYGALSAVNYYHKALHLGCCSSDIPAKLLSFDISCESFFVELNFWKKKWLLDCSSNPKSDYIESILNCLFKSIDAHSSKYENITLLGEFNSCMLDSWMKAFCETYKLCSGRVQ